MSVKLTIEEIIAHAANGDAHARRWLTAMLRFSDTLDNLVDCDVPVTPARAGLDALMFAHECATNPFFQQYRERLLALMEAGVTAWIDSHEPRFERERDVLKGMYHEVVWQVARLTGGMDRMRELQGIAREFDHEKEGK